jgi:Ca2+-binding EF-hand superfamily protein
MFAAAAALQSQQAAAAIPERHSYAGVGRGFLSPMGEPFFGRTADEDGLVAWFEQADRNHDGVLTSDEMTADAQRFFETLDTNHDGEIDPDEITHYETAIATQVRSGFVRAPQEQAAAGQQEGGWSGGHGGGGGGHRGGRGHRGGGGGGFGGGGGGDDEARAGRYGLLEIPEPVASADSDFNRGVSAEEFRVAAVQRFQQLDLNHTGRLTLQELQAIRQDAIADSRRPPVTKPDLNDDGSPGQQPQM